MSADPPPRAARVALATCRRIPDLTRDDRLLLGPLRAAGVEAHAVAWDDERSDWTAFDAVVIRSTWDYHARPGRFRRWLDSCEAAGVRLWNPPTVLRWNLHKSYLRDVAARGVPVVPTVWLARGSNGSLRELLEERGWKRAVVKPAISAGARRTSLVSLADAREADPGFQALLARRDLLVQPFLAGIVDEGEWSFVFFGRAFSHAVLKRPRAQDFRVQEQFGGSVEIADPVPGLVERAERVLAAVDGDLLYARVDAVREGDDLLLVELEVLEPSLFLAQAPGAARRLAGEIASRLPGRTPPTAAHSGR